MTSIASGLDGCDPDAIKPRRIALLVSDLRIGGAERVAAELAGHWAASGIRVDLVATYSRQVGCEIAIPLGTHLIRLADATRRGHGRVLNYYWRLRSLRSFIRDSGPDVIVSFLTNVNVFALIATIGIPGPVVVSERTDPASENETGAVLRWLRKVAYQLAACVVVQTDRTAKSLATRVWNVRRIEVIPNPIPKGIAVIKPVEGDSHGSRRIVALGRLAQAKRFDVLISAFASLSSQYPDWSLWIWGDGPLRQTLSTQVSRLGLSQRVFLSGKTARPWAELVQAEIYALSSDFEGFPNSMLEAMALGKACVATDCPSGPRELSRGGTAAILVQPGDVEAMSVALKRLIESGELRQQLGQLAQQAVHEDCSIDVVLAKWNNLFSTLRP